MANEDEKTTPVIKGVKLWNNLKDSRLFAAIVTGVLAIVGTVILYSATIGVGTTEARSRTFDLLSNRETAAQTLQAQVFGVFVEHVVPSLREGVNDHQKVALLAGLHGNFSEFFDTRSVFEAFAEEVSDLTARHELTRLAKRVARRQAEYTKVHVPESGNAIMSTQQTLIWPQTPETTFPLAVHEVTLKVSRPQRRPDPGESNPITPANSSLIEVGGDYEIDDVSDLVAVSIAFTPPPKRGIWPFLLGLLNMDTPEKEEESFQFDLSYMDTPYMDNIWLRHADGSHHQVALRLIDINKLKRDEDTTKRNEDPEYSIEIEILHFPGDVYAPTQRLPIEELLEGGHAH